MARILILIGAHICTAPRPQKEADFIASLGHEVMVRGVWFDPDLVARDETLTSSKSWEFRPALDFRPDRVWANFTARMKRRFALQRYARMQSFSPALLGYGAKEMLREALKLRPDLTIVHSEAGLWVGAELLRRGFQVGVDFEDWFSEDLPPRSREGRPLSELRAFESTLLQNCSYALAPSNVMARELAESFSAPAPEALYNVFPWEERSYLDHQHVDRKSHEMPSLHWFSHTIGRGRGLETLFAALSHLDRKVEIHLRGRISEEMRNWIFSEIPPEFRSHLFFHDLVPNNELLSRIAEHDIGLAIEDQEVKSRDLTVTNKLFQYMLAGLAIVATRTQGQEEVMSSWADPAQLVSCGNAEALAAALNMVLESKETLEATKQASLKAAEQTYCWEQQCEKIKDRLNEALVQEQSSSG